MTIFAEQDVIARLLTDKPAFHLGGEARWDALPRTLEWIREAAFPGAVSIETGAGASTVVFASRGARHTAISPDPGEHEQIRAYCSTAGVDNTLVSFVEGLSDDVLPALLGRERTLDVAFIDGAHSFPFPEVDWYYIARALKIGGRLLLDDIPIPAVAPVFRHMLAEPNWRLDGVLDDRAAAFTLLAPPAPEDWSSQPFNDGYPDLSFARMPRRLRLRAAHLAGRLRQDAAVRHPVLYRAYKRIT